MKKRTTARIISVLLAAVMLITAAPVTGEAAEITADDKSILTEGEVLSGDVEAGETDEAGPVSEGAEITDAADDVIEEDGQGLILDDGNTADIADEETGDDEASGEIFTGDPVSGNGLSDNAVSGNSVSENIVSGNTVSANTVSGNGVEDSEGYMYPGEKDGQAITFTCKNNGTTRVERVIFKYLFSSSEQSKTVEALLGGTCDKVLKYMWNEVDGNFVDATKGETILEWDVSIDGVYVDTLTPDQVKSMTIYKTRDYHLTACVKKKLAKELYIDCIPGVYYTGRAHVTMSTPAKGKNKSKDRDIALNVSGSDGEKLTLGKDYTVKYKNNKEASMKMDDGNNGIYEQKYSNLNKRPYMIITGKGNYKGFSARAYFDIYPYNFGKQDPHVEISGLKNTYALKNGKISGFKTPKITIGHKGLKKKTLKEGKDYEVVVYRFVPDTWSMFDSTGMQRLPAAENLKEEGQYLYAVRGKGNYCGVFGGQSKSFDFRTTGPKYQLCPGLCETYTEDQAPWQFKITNDTKLDLANARVVIKHPTVNYDFKNGMLYNEQTAFGLTVEYKDGNKWRELENNTYDVFYIGKSFDYIYGVDAKDNAVIKKYVYEENEDSLNIIVAGEYKVVVKAKKHNWKGVVGSITAKKKVKVKGISAKYKKFKKPTIKYNGAPSTASDLEAAYNTKGLKYRIVASPRAAMNNYFEPTADGKIYRISDDYLKIARGPDRINPRNVCPVNIVDDIMPGTYKNEFLAVGGGIDHGKPFLRKYKRVGITLKEAEKTINPLLGTDGEYVFGVDRTHLNACTFNANGAYPQNVGIRFNGEWNYLGTMSYNGQEFSITDHYNNTIKIKIWAYNNKKPGNDAYFVVEGDGKVFKGKSRKFNYSIMQKTVGEQIPVIGENSESTDKWYMSHGKSIPMTLDGKKVNEGNLYAIMTPIKKDKKKVIPSKPGIAIYQAAYKNKADFQAKKLSLIKVDTKYYKLNLIDKDTINHNEFEVVVTPGSRSGYIYRPYPGTNPTKLSRNYTLYNGSVKISKIIVEYESALYDITPKRTIYATYTGKKIEPKVKEVYLSDGTTLTSFDYLVVYGDNITSGKKKGSIKIITKRNSETNVFRAGSKTFYFNIAGHGSETL